MTTPEPHASGALAVKGKKSSGLSECGRRLAAGPACLRLFRVGGGDFKSLCGGRAGRRPLPRRAGTGCEPQGRQGGGEASGGRPPPHIWDPTLPAPDAASPPPPEPQDTRPGARGVHSAGPGRPGPLSRVLRDPQVPAPAQGPGPQMPSAPSWSSRGLGKSAPRREARPAPGFEDRRMWPCILPLGSQL